MESEARKLSLAAFKKKEPGMFKAFSNMNMKLEEAASLFIDSANKFKGAKNYGEAAKAFVEAGNCYQEKGIDSKHEAATQWVAAAQMFKKAEPPNTDESIKYMKQAINAYVDLGRFHIAAKHEKEIAEVHDGNGNLPAAIESYAQAAEWFEGEDAKTNATTCKLKVAHFHAQLEHYPEACAIFEQIATAGVNDNLTRYSVKEYFFKAGILYLANQDVIGAANAYQRFLSTDATFESTRESTFLKNMIGAVEENDSEAFTNFVVEYDTFKKLDNWTTTILLRIKKTINADGPLA